MEISLTIILFLFVVFVLRKILLERITSSYRYHEPVLNKYTAIPSIKVLNAICFVIVLLCMVLGVWLFEFYHDTSEFSDEILWYLMLVCIAISGVYYGLMLYNQYFYITLEDDYIEFNLKIGKRSADAIKILLTDVERINKDTNGYHIQIKNEGNYFISFRNIRGLIGSETLKNKLDELIS